MSFIVNDIVWWKISLESVINSWVPGIATFMLGVWFSRIDERRKLKQKLKDDLLQIFIPIFNSGQAITMLEAESTARRTLHTFNAYKRIYPGAFNKEAEDKLGAILADGFLVNNKVNHAFMEPDVVQDLIKTL